MDFKEYRIAIDEFYEIIGQSQPPTGVVSSWFGYFERLSLATFTSVLERMQAELDRRPFNMLNKIKEYVGIFIQENPDARPQKVDQECSDCNGQGYFVVKSEGEPNQMVVLCGSCENWQKTYGTTRGKARMKLFELKYKGFEIVG